MQPWSFLCSSHALTCLLTACSFLQMILRDLCRFMFVYLVFLFGFSTGNGQNKKLEVGRCAAHWTSSGSAGLREKEPGGEDRCILASDRELERTHICMSSKTGKCDLGSVLSCFRDAVLLACCIATFWPSFYPTFFSTLFQACRKHSRIV